MVIGALKRSLGSGSERDSNLVPRLRVRGRSGRWLMLYGSLSESTVERPSETVVVVELAKPEEVAWLYVAARGRKKSSAWWGAASPTAGSLRPSLSRRIPSQPSP